LLWAGGPPVSSGGIVIGILIMLIALFLIRNTPESMGLIPDSDIRKSPDSRPEPVELSQPQKVGSTELTPKQAMRT